MIRSDSGQRVETFSQKPTLNEYVNGGFIVLKPEIFEHLSDGMIEDTFIRLASERQLSVYHHDGFWKAMDTYQEVEELNRMWAESRPWAIWERSKP